MAVTDSFVEDKLL